MGWSFRVLLLGLILSACVRPSSTDKDAGAHSTAQDAGAVDAAQADAAPPDAGTSDANTDADAASPVDAAMPPDSAFPGDAGLPENTQRVRIMAANLSSGNGQSYDPGEGLRILQGLHGDVVMIQEFNVGDNSDTALRAFVDSACGATCSYAREPGVPGDLPNGVISRFPILASGEWVDSSISNRAFVWARVDVPGSQDLWAISVHLKSSSSSVATRTAEANQLVGYLSANVPPSDLLVVGGDLNTYSNSTTSEPALAAFATALTITPLPDDGTGNTGTAANRLTAGSTRQPYDRVMPDPHLNALSIPVLVGSSFFPNGLVFDSHVYQPLSDVAPVLFDDSYALNMQHMAVVRDFALPSTP